MPTAEEAADYARGRRPTPAYATMQAAAARAPHTTDLACKGVFGQLTRRPPSVIR